MIYTQFLLLQLLAQPAIQHIKCVRRLIIRNHVSSTEDAQECESTVLCSAELTTLFASCSRVPFCIIGCCEFFTTTPRQLQGPCLVAEPIADKVSISSVNQYPDTIFKNRRHFINIRPHPVTGKLYTNKLERTHTYPKGTYVKLEIDLHVTAFIFPDLSANSLLDIFPVQVFLNALQNLVA